MIAPGSLVLDGRFRVLQSLGSGGMGEVYLGEQVSLGRKVAIKVLHQDLSTQPGMLERFQREARLLSAVEHPAVVRVIDYGETSAGACLVMEYVEGESLYDVLLGGALPPARALPLLYQLAEGLAAIHEKGIVHRDIKPENVLLTRGPRGEQARLLDFGIARLVEPDTASNLSQVGVVLGTPEYLSPEQAVGAKVDERSDLYCFGVLAYRVLSGQLPFPGPGPSQYVAQHAGATPRPLIEAAPHLVDQPGLVALVSRLLEKEPERRLPNALALVDALGQEAALVGATVGSPVAAAMGAAGADTIAPAISWSGTSVFGAPAPAPSEASDTAAFGSPSLPQPAPRATSTQASASSGTLAGKAQNLTVMLTSLHDFTERTSRQTHEQNARMLETLDGLLQPWLREHGGKLVQKRGDSMLAVFSSPTSAVLCGMAMQDRLWRHGQQGPPEERLGVRISLHTGEVLVLRDTLLGEPVELVKRVEQVAEPGEVTFTESVNLARNRAEAEAEPRGSVALPGSGEPLRLYQCTRAAEGPPFGGRDVLPERPALTKILASQLVPVVQPVRRAWSRQVPRLVALARANPRRAAGVGLGALLLLGLTTYEVVRRSNPLVQAWARVEDGQPEEALKGLEALPEEARQVAAARRVRAAALHGLEKHAEEEKVLAGLDEAGLAEVEELLLDGLAEDFGRRERDKGLRKVLASLPQERLREHFEELAEEEHSPRQWGALRYLEAEQHTEGLDLVKLYTRALESEDCAVRASAARRLAALGDEKAVPALEKLSQAPKEKGSRGCGQAEAAKALRVLKKKSD
ncbi:MAG TPA: protein kinase [Myxococcaceae bacterium]|nr:protein kinase [Myxococcaceae bacterium]